MNDKQIALIAAAIYCTSDRAIKGKTLGAAANNCYEWLKLKQKEELEQKKKKSERV